MKRTRRPTILIVDDDDEWREFLTTALSPTYFVRASDNGNGGFALAQKLRPALIILDAMMPGGMDGFTMLCELKKNARTREIPVIICSEVNAVAGLQISTEKLREHLGVAPASILEKPVSPEILLSEVARVLQFR